VQSETEAARLASCDNVAALPEEERAQLVEALLHILERQPAGPAFAAAVDLADRAPDVLPAVCAKLMQIPPNAVPVLKVGRAVMRLRKSDPAVAAVFEHWEGSGIQALATAVTRARTMQDRSGR